MIENRLEYLAVSAGVLFTAIGAAARLLAIAMV